MNIYISTPYDQETGGKLIYPKPWLNMNCHLSFYASNQSGFEDFLELNLNDSLFKAG